MFIWDENTGDYVLVESLDLLFSELKNEGYIAMHCLTKEDIDRICDSSYDGELSGMFVWLDKYGQN